MTDDIDRCSYDILLLFYAMISVCDLIVAYLPAGQTVKQKNRSMLKSCSYRPKAMSQDWCQSRIFFRVQTHLQFHRFQHCTGYCLQQLLASLRSTMCPLDKSSELGLIAQPCSQGLFPLLWLLPFLLLLFSFCWSTLLPLLVLTMNLFHWLCTAASFPLLLYLIQLCWRPRYVELISDPADYFGEL